VLDIRLLGPVEVVHNGERIALGRRRERWILGCLPLEAGTVVPACGSIVDVSCPDNAAITGHRRAKGALTLRLIVFSPVV